MPGKAGSGEVGLAVRDAAACGAALPKHRPAPCLPGWHKGASPSLYCNPIPSALQGPSRDMMLNGYFKNRVLAWSKEPAGEAPVLVQVGASGGTRTMCICIDCCSSRQGIMPGPLQRGQASW